MTYRYKEPKAKKPKPKTSFPFTGADWQKHVARATRFTQNGIPFEVFHTDNEDEVALVIEPATHPFMYLLKMGITCDEERSREITREELSNMRIMLTGQHGGTTRDTTLVGAATLWMHREQEKIRKIDEDPLGLGL